MKLLKKAFCMINTIPLFILLMGLNEEYQKKIPFIKVKDVDDWFILNGNELISLDDTIERLKG